MLDPQSPVTIEDDGVPHQDIRNVPSSTSPDFKSATLGRYLTVVDKKVICRRASAFGTDCVFGYIKVTVAESYIDTEVRIRERHTCDEKRCVVRERGFLQ